ncbi:hypothetical protein QR680_003161 [Steinernema hermaphroditum]|uniref:Core Histone H2A/H2B/H3 domain-containing protein n=1 Tax=Steinernema hermaphroditum TaxID=289476 RepID=A0AA39H7U2_9BILA|nr:hypothetical protein QR680_003161 [Steinernema hermaphroditum]
MRLTFRTQMARNKGTARKVGSRNRSSSSVDASDASSDGSGPENYVDGSELSGFVSRNMTRPGPYSEASGFVSMRYEPASEVSARRGAPSDVSGFISTRRGAPSEVSELMSVRRGAPSDASGFVDRRRIRPSARQVVADNNEWSDDSDKEDEDDDDASGFVSTRKGLPSEVSGFVKPRNIKSKRTAQEDPDSDEVQSDWSEDGEDDDASGFVSRRQPLSTVEARSEYNADLASEPSGFVSRRGPPTDASGFVSRNGDLFNTMPLRRVPNELPSEASGFISNRPPAAVLRTGGPKPKFGQKAMKGKVNKLANPNRRRPGERAEMEIRKYRRTATQLIPKLPFSRFVRETCEFLQKDNFRFAKEAMVALQEATEALLVHIFEQAQICAIHGKRVTVMPRDLHLVRLLRNDF